MVKSTKNIAQILSNEKAICKVFLFIRVKWRSNELFFDSSFLHFFRKWILHLAESLCNKEKQQNVEYFFAVSRKGKLFLQQNLKRILRKSSTHQQDYFTVNAVRTSSKQPQSFLQKQANQTLLLLTTFFETASKWWIKTNGAKAQSPRLFHVFVYEDLTWCIFYICEISKKKSSNVFQTRKSELFFRSENRYCQDLSH